MSYIEADNFNELNRILQNLKGKNVAFRLQHQYLHIDPNERDILDITRREMEINDIRIDGEYCLYINNELQISLNPNYYNSIELFNESRLEITCSNDDVSFSLYFKEL